MGFIDKYAYRLLRRKAAAYKRQVKLPHPDDIRKVGVLWQPAQKEAFIFLQDYFMHKQVIFRNICIDITAVTNETDSNVITSKDLNWLGFPKKTNAEDFLKMEFDLLMNIALEQNKVLDYLSAMSHANFKIGSSPDENNYFDLNIKIKENQDALYLAKQQIFYLSQLNKKI